MSITALQYFGSKPHPMEHDNNAHKLLERVNLCLDKAKQDGCYESWIDPDTNSQISGSKGGSGDGGYRTPDSRTGGASSSHRSARGVDIYDPFRTLAQWCVKNKETLAKLGLYCEDFRWTNGWCHFQSVPPGSGKRIYIPYADWKKHPPTEPALEGQDKLPFVVKV